MDEIRWLSKKLWVGATEADVRAALACGAGVSARGNGSTPLSKAASFSREPAVVAAFAGADVTLKEGPGFTPTSVVGSVGGLDHGADPNARNDSDRRHTAAVFGSQPETIALLVERGADLEARNDRSLTPLLAAAAASEYPGMVAVLLVRGADLEARSDHGTALH